MSQTKGEEFNLNASTAQYASADEIFIHLSVPQVQKLNTEYKQKVVQAKQDLHNLVGEKYRDLIRIAEDINSMHLETGEVDSRLSDLSYGRSKFVNFHDANPCAKFESTLRGKNAELARNDSKLTILKYLINMTLLSFDLKLISGKSNAPFKHTSRYIHLAKVYCTIEDVFEDTFEAHPYVREKFQRFKTNFSSFLEKELASYNASTNSLYSNESDIYKHYNMLQFSDLLIPGKSTTFLEDGTIDIYGEDETEDINSLDEDEFDDTEWDTLEHYQTNSSPLVNFLISYIILHHHDPQLQTMNKVLEKFVVLRQSYLERLTSELLLIPTPQIIKIKLLKLFNFIENTCQYVSQYFEEPSVSHNDLLKHLMNYTTTWKTQDVIGFHNWFTKDETHVDQEAFIIAQSSATKSLNFEALTKFAKTAFLFTESVISKINESGDAFQQVSKLLALLHNVVINLKKVEVYSASNHNKSILIEIVCKSELLSNFLEQIINSVTSVHDIHSKSINEKDDAGSVLFAITSALERIAPSKNLDAAPSLFSTKLVSMMDTDLDNYIEMMTEASVSRSLTTASSSSTEYVCSKINEWFDIYFELTALLATSAVSNTNNNRTNQILPHLLHFLRRKFEFLGDESSNWGDFSVEMLERRFSTLNSHLTAALWKVVSALLDHLSVQVKHYREVNDVHNVYFLLGVLITLKDRTISAGKDEIKITESIDSMVRELYSYIFSNISNATFEDELSFVDMFTQINQSVIRKEFSALDDGFILPSLKLASLVYRLSNRLLSPDKAESKTNYTKAQLFLSMSVRELFIEIKNQWIWDELIEGIIWKGVLSCGDKQNRDVKSDEEGVITKIHLHQAAQIILANIIYLVCFTRIGPLSITDEEVQKEVLRINSVSDIEISEAETNLILKKVNEYYRSNKGVYLPILIS